MYCVIQEIETKKEDKCGHPKELKSEYKQCTIMRKDCSHFYYSYGDEKFERPIKKAYRISIHESYREKGEVSKRQIYICTIGYYEIVDFGGYIPDSMTSERKNDILGKLHMNEETMLDLIYVKFQPIIEQVQQEFRQSEEYRVQEEHRRIIKLYAAKKAKFSKKYGVDGDEYDRCYDVFGVLRNKKNLDIIKAEYKARKDYESAGRSYYEKYYDNYTNGSSPCIGNNSNESDKVILKQFYRELSKRYHPDANPDMDTSEQMKVLNQLKSEWGL